MASFTLTRKRNQKKWQIYFPRGKRRGTKKADKEFKDLAKKIKTSLCDTVTDVRLTLRLATSPACLVTGEHDMSANLNRILKAAGKHVPESKPILELNPEHPLVVRLNGESNETRFADMIHSLFDQACWPKAATSTPGHLRQTFERVVAVTG